MESSILSVLPFPWIQTLYILCMMYCSACDCMTDATVVL